MTKQGSGPKYILHPTRRFERELSKFRRAHPELRRKIAGALRDLETDPFQPRLRLHPLHGELAGFQAVRLTYSYRIVLVVEVTEKAVVLHDIGSHDEVYR